MGRFDKMSTEGATPNAAAKIGKAYDERSTDEFNS